MEPNMIDTPRDFERMLREKGFSRARAKAITAKGFHGGGAIAPTEIGEMIETLNLRRSALTEKALPLLLAPVLGKIAIGAISGLLAAYVYDKIKDKRHAEIVRKAEDLLLAYSLRARGRRRTKVVRLRPGQKETIPFPVDHRSGMRRVIILSDGNGEYSYEAKLRSPSWKGGTLIIKEKYFDGILTPTTTVREHIEIGTQMEVRKWLNSIDKTILAAGRTVLRDERLPYFEFTYKRAIDSDARDTAEFMVEFTT